MERRLLCTGIEPVTSQDTRLHTKRPSLRTSLTCSCEGHSSTNKEAWIDPRLPSPFRLGQAAQTQGLSYFNEPPNKLGMMVSCIDRLNPSPKL